jgi:signal transduction histidine kinase
MTKLLVIDDERPILEMYEISLGTEGYEVVTAESGSEGLKIFSEHSPKLVITDIKMPGMDGIEVLRRIKALDSEAEVIVITGHGDMDSAIAALHYGASDFINKPIRLDALLLALERAKRQITLSRQLRDYTENLEKRVQECTMELRQAQEELIKSERLATIGETVAGLAHSIKNILTGLHGGTYMVNTGLAKDKSDMVETGWAIVQRNIKKISDLSLEFLRYSKERVPERTLCSPNEIASEVVELLGEHAKQHNITLNKVVDTNLKEAYLDREGIYQVLLNLVSNAIDACIYDPDTSKSWEVTVRTRLETDAGSGEAVLLEVTDNGMGIVDEVEKKLFTRFLSTKAGRGTGLGLLITQKIVREHGGEIHVDTKPGHGTTFSVRLKMEVPEDDPRPQQKDITT